MKNDNNLIKVYVFKHSKDSFIQLLNENNIDYKTKQYSHDQQIVNSAEVIEIIKAIGEASIFPSIATVIVQWLKNKRARKIILQTEQNEVVHLEGYELKEVIKFLETAKNISVIQTEPDDDA